MITFCIRYDNSLRSTVALHERTEQTRKSIRKEKERERKKIERATMSRGLSTEEDQRARKGQRWKDSKEFHTARTQIRWTMDILMRDRFFRPRDLPIR